jgi:mycofactocin precursor
LNVPACPLYTGTWCHYSRGGRVDDEELVEEELLVEDVSIDGMCGVY